MNGIELAGEFERLVVSALARARAGRGARTGDASIGR